MTKETIIKELKKVAGADKDKARLFADVIRDIIVEGLTSDGIVKIKGLGTFKVIEVKARKSVNVNTGAEIEIAAHKKVTFTAENQLADEVNEPFSNMEVVNLGESGETVKKEKKPAEEKPAVAEKEIEKVPETSDADIPKEDEAMRRLDEDAESLKGILAMINGPLTVNQENQEAEPEQIEPVVNSTIHDEQEEEVVEQKQPVKPLALAVTYESDEPVASVPVVSHESLQTVVPEKNYESTMQTRPQSIDLGPAPKIKSNYWKTVAIIVALLLSGGVAVWYLFLSDNALDFGRGSKRITKMEKPKMSAEEKEKARQVELERIKEEAREMGNDEDDSTYVYTGIKKPGNNEPLPDGNALAVVRVKDGDRLMSLSKQYYGHKMFWVYIYEANIKKLRSPNDLQVGMQLVIPRLDPKLTDIENVESMEKAARMEARYLGN